MDEVTLTGGNMNTVVRVGDTVRRSAGPATPTIHRLLTHAREHGARWVPEPLGYDELGREILSFVPGDVPHAMPEWVWSDAVLSGVGRALRQWHDATSMFDASGAIWNLSSREPHEVICHNDFAPYNCVFREGRFAGAIDFDLCSPGPRLWDVAYTAYRFVPLMPPRNLGESWGEGEGERSPFDLSVGLTRLSALLGAYAEGAPSRRYDAPAVFDMAVARLEAIAAWTSAHVARTGHRALENHARTYQAHAGWIRGHFGVG